MRPALGNEPSDATRVEKRGSSPPARAQAAANGTPDRMECAQTRCAAAVRAPVNAARWGGGGGGGPPPGLTLGPRTRTSVELRALGSYPLIG